ncbi:hypothetical protein [Microcoleus sp. herbarium12]
MGEYTDDGNSLQPIESSGTGDRPEMLKSRSSGADPMHPSGS